MSAIPGGGGVVVDDGFEIENFAGIIGGGGADREINIALPSVNADYV